MRSSSIVTCCILAIAATVSTLYSADEVVRSPEETRLTRDAKRQSAAFAVAAGGSGIPMDVILPAVSTSTLFSGDFAYWIDVPADATRLEVRLVTSTPGADLDLYVRYDQEPELVSGRVVADFSSRLAGTGNELVTVNPPELKPGRYYFAFVTFTLNREIRATVTPTISRAGCIYTLGPGTGATIPAAGGTGSLTVSAGVGCQWGATSNSPWITITSGASGSGSGTVAFRVTSDTGQGRTGQILVADKTYVITQNPAPLTSFPSNAQAFSHIVMGSSWSTSLLVTNLSLIPELCTIRFYKDDGSPWRIGAAGSGDSIAAPLVPGETRVFDLSQAGNLEQGWAVLIPGTPSATRISGFAVFQLRISATLSSEAVVGMTNVTDRQFVVLYDNTSGFDTGVALANPNPLTALTITATVRNDTGRVLSTDTLSLPALGHTSFSMPQKFPASANQRGSLLISSSPSGIVGLGLRFNSFLTFTSFPALTSPDIQR